MTPIDHFRVVRHLSVEALVVGASAILLAGLIPAVAYGATPSGAPTEVGSPKLHASSLCSAVSAASISALIGYKVPAGTGTTFKIKPTKANYGISGTNIVCTYGGAASMAALLKDVSLSYEVISKPITTAEIEQSMAAVSKDIKFKFSTYSGLGVPGFYFSLSEAGIVGQGISGEQTSTRFFGASVESKTVSKSTLAALAKLAEKL
jgi:hypothetical protein